MNDSDLMLQLNLSYNFKTRPQIWHKALSLIDDNDICLEFGVYNGHSINYMSSVNPNNMFFGFDSFEGLPEKWNEKHPIGHFKTNFLKLKFNQNVQIKLGLFSETIPDFLLEIKKK